MARRPGGTSTHGDGGRRARPGRIGSAAATSAHRPRPEADAPLPPTDPSLVQMGEFGRAHGLNGEVRLKSYTGDPQAIASYGPLIGADGRRVELTDVRQAGGASPDLLVVRVKGVGDRTGAEGLNRLALYLPRERLGTVSDADEFFTADLVGLAVVDTQGTVLGTVADVPNYGGGDLLEIKPALGGATALLPFTKIFVPELDIAGGRVVVDPPEDLFAPAQPRPPDEPA
ncbi:MULTISPECIES: ribosome maturation factor RimM [unclassified Methylobacterium]|uniref:ribosome maturation factor RimM n=1 Tax=unclassified Methylobacterium TaxID=2615210 RepID=UPI000701A7B7|nr:MULTISPECIES: ribosome maturation factor RimM [unclassified Methylobacterium]KQO74343.1 16S rRNA processing protein RimM [Methylobacterium sp. Leaf88]KQP76552.1 16S rRNA processing protein RimM [Methylobacterium sp. Leaf111]KQT84561.1 16S rRNA processing protein RimM [Methylobacterium sp. Leaf465]KQU35095.1 16S rRNA processing protein RimM [Methylobacterium sp. Leaf94]